MKATWKDAAALFEQACEVPANEQERFIESACNGNAELAERVRAMLRADAADSPVLDATPDKLTAFATPEVATTHVGRHIGPYRIKELLGQGGMGVVYLAEREDVGKKVALKLVAGAFASPDRSVRFFRERRVLAQLEHPHIARLLDAGMTDDGTPWLAMEYVPGESIDAFSIAHGLSIEQRLLLFERVCGAVAYAHRHLVVHRDLKPSNILVSPDGEPHLVDFGIAKLLDPSDAASPSNTVTTLHPMTPQYASPEMIHGGVITTASDIYQLGVLLFELLTGHKPHPKRATSSGVAAVDEVRKPSGVVDRTLARRLAGDLDNVVLKATRIEPAQRYATAEQLAEDVRRHLQGVPVLARPATPAYRARKFVARHRIATATSVLVVLGLLGLALAMVEQTQRIAAQRNRAEQVSTLLVDLFANADPAVAQGDTISAGALLDRGTERIHADAALAGEVKGRLLWVIASAQGNLGRIERSTALLGEAVTALQSVPVDDPARLDATRELAARLAEAGAADSAAVLTRELLAVGRKLPRSRRIELANILGVDGYVKQISSDAAGARVAYEEALAHYRSVPDSLHQPMEKILINLSFLAERRGDQTASEALRREVLARRRARLGANHSMTAKSMTDLAGVLVETGKLEEAEALIRDAISIQRRVYPAPHGDVANGLLVAARVFAARGKFVDAEAVQREALALARDIYGVNSNRPLALGTANLAGYIEKQGRLDEAAALHREAIRMYTAILGERDVSTAIVTSNLAYNAYLQGRLEESELLYRRAVPVLDSVWRGTTQIERRLNDFAEVLSSRGKCVEAEVHLRRILAMPLQDKPPKSPPILRAQQRLGHCLVNRGRLAEAEPLLVEAHQKLLAGWGADDPLTRSAARELVMLYERTRRHTEAERYRQRPAAGSRSR
jgi:serine/threonine-protein kinase